MHFHDPDKIVRTDPRDERTDLMTVAVPKLIELHNEMAESLSKPSINSWKKAKAGLIKKIEDLRFELEFQAEPPTEPHVPEPVVEVQIEDPDIATQPTIREQAIEYLCAIAYYENRDLKSGGENIVEPDHPKARSVGYAYDHIVRMIHERFEGSKTSIECLRWYAVKIRGEEFGYEGLRMPQRRPRAQSKGKANV